MFPDFCLTFAGRYAILLSFNGVSPSGKAQDFDSCIRWFESNYPSHEKRIFCLPKDAFFNPSRRNGGLVCNHRGSAMYVISRTAAVWHQVRKRLHMLPVRRLDYIHLLTQVITSSPVGLITYATSSQLHTTVLPLICPCGQPI